MNISIIEFLVYGFITYTTFLMLIISTIYGNTTERIKLYRSIYFIPGIICAVVLASSGVDITLDTVDTTKETYDNQTSTLMFTEYTSTTDKFTLLEPIWILVHYLLFAVMVVYVLLQVLSMFTKID